MHKYSQWGPWKVNGAKEMPVKIGDRVWVKLLKNQMGSFHEMEMVVQSDKNWLMKHHPEYQLVTYYRKETNLLWRTIGWLDHNIWPVLAVIMFIVMLPVALFKALFSAGEAFFDEFLGTMGDVCSSISDRANAAWDGSEKK